MSFEQLKQQAAAGRLLFPSHYVFGQKRLQEIADPKLVRSSYTVKEKGTSRELPLEEYKARLLESLLPYQSEAFFKGKIISEIENLAANILRDADLIASNKGMDEHWVKEALSHIRYRDRAHRKELKQTLEALVACVEKNILSTASAS